MKFGFSKAAQWDLSEADYPQIKVFDHHVSGLSCWIEKIIELAQQHDGTWDVLLADLWPNDGRSRLIGFVQMKDAEIGRDIGFRVCAYLENNGIEGDTGDDIPLIREWLIKAALKRSTRKKLHKISKSNPFEIRLTCWGSGKVSDGIEIKF